MNMVVEPAPTRSLPSERLFRQRVPLALIAGPCALESRDHAFDMGGRAQGDRRQGRHRLVYKTSSTRRTDQRQEQSRHRARGACRSSRTSAQRSAAHPHDVHEAQQCAIVAEVVACCKSGFLCGRTDLLQAAAATGRGST